MKLKFFLMLLIAAQLQLCAYAIPQYYCTAANKEYYPHLINLIGSIHKTNFNELEQIAVYDLGLTEEQKQHINTIKKVKLYKILPTHPDLLKPFHTGHRWVPGWYAWKPVAIKQALDMFPYVLWIDAGSTVLRSLDDLFKHIDQNDYFFCTIGSAVYDPTGYPVSWGTTNYIKNKFDLENKPWFRTKEFIMANTMGISRKIHYNFLMPLYELTRDLKNFQDDGTAPNGFGCGRHDQTLVSIIAYSLGLTVYKQDPTGATPILLSVDGQKVPFNITWDKTCVYEGTHIYSSRANLNLEYYKSFIHY